VKAPGFDLARQWLTARRTPPAKQPHVMDSSEHPPMFPGERKKLFTVNTELCQPRFGFHETRVEREWQNAVWKELSAVPEEEFRLWRMARPAVLDSEKHAGGMRKKLFDQDLILITKL
jgi:hypothetical protein